MSGIYSTGCCDHYLLERADGTAAKDELRTSYRTNIILSMGATSAYDTVADQLYKPGTRTTTPLFGLGRYATTNTQDTELPDERKKAVSDFLKQQIKLDKEREEHERITDNIN